MNTQPKFDVAGIGNAIVDIVAPASRAFLAEHGLGSGTMQLVDDATATRLQQAIGAGTQSSGGSAANTIAGLASLGARCAFMGKTADDALGESFGKDIRALGVHFPSEPLAAPAATARGLVLVPPDAQRTMATFLGASSQLGPQDVDATTIAGAAIIYLEGYLFDPPQAKLAFRRAVDLAHAAGGRVALTLSDPFCVDRHREDFLALIEKGIDILFANEAEIASLLGTTSLDSIQARLAPHCGISVITQSERGSAVVTEDAVQTVAAVTIGPLVDTTGAGDLYASGFLFGLAKGLDLRASAALGSLCAAEAISHYGARPLQSLQALAASHSLYPPPH